MKYLLSVLALGLTLGHSAMAKNTTSRIGQVTEAVTLSSNVDYIITGGTPFAVTGSINITNTEHAVIILENIRPSQALSYLSFITINGEKAVNDENCQVKMYAQGAIILPYSKNIKPLTVYSEQNFEGKAVNDFGLENSGGYMNTLTTTKLNNAIRSFKLKRGYMVTFSTRPSGRGYSRCFIADEEDLEFATLPNVLDRRISSYRIFKWNDAEKKGIANNTTREATQALNVSWCYHSWTLGYDMGMDTECVPHHYKESWPPIADCGRVTYSPHLKNNNEPANNSDEEPATVEQCLANWENLMATGMRLCSPSSHDGGLTWLRNFMNEIDARGWRCDILDMHAYWATGTFYSLQNWYNDYKRPIWLSEFLWGSSWGGSNPDTGFFAATSGDERDFSSIKGQQINYDGMKPILDNLNQWPYVERYAYWNGWGGASQIYVDGTLSILGKHYATMKSGMGYNKAYEYVPKVVLKNLSELATTYKVVKGQKQVTLAWENPNGEMTDVTYVEQEDKNGNWTAIDTIAITENTTFTMTYDLGANPEGGMRNYRIHTVDCDGKERYSNESSISIGGVEKGGSLQYGRLEIANTDDVVTYFSAADEQSSTPAVFMGMPSLNNTTVGLAGAVKGVGPLQFSYCFTPWTLQYPTTLTSPETIDAFIIAKGHHTFGELDAEVGDVPQNVAKDTVEVTFAQPFPEGVTPIVMAATNPLRALAFPTTIKVFDITNTGFKTKVTRQADVSITMPGFQPQKAVYMAITPGTARLDNGKRISAGISSGRIGGATVRNITFTLPDGSQAELRNPYIVAAPQTHFIDAATLFRQQRFLTRNVTTEDGKEEVVYGMSCLRQVDKTANIKSDLAAYNGDYIGWIAVSDDKSLVDAIGETPVQPAFSIKIANRCIWVNGADNARIYTTDGKRVNPGTPVAPGLYIVNCGKQSMKILVK